MILTMVAVVVFIQTVFALIYLLPEERVSTYLTRISADMGVEQKITSFLDAFCFSGVTLFTVGYGDIILSGGFRFIAPSEFYIGTLVIFALFTFGGGWNCCKSPLP